MNTSGRGSKGVGKLKVYCRRNAKEATPRTKRSETKPSLSVVPLHFAGHPEAPHTPSPPILLPSHSPPLTLSLLPPPLLTPLSRPSNPPKFTLPCPLSACPTPPPPTFQIRWWKVDSGSRVREGGAAGRPHEVRGSREEVAVSW